MALTLQEIRAYAGAWLTPQTPPHTHPPTLTQEMPRDALSLQLLLGQLLVTLVQSSCKAISFHKRLIVLFLWVH